MNLQRLKKFLFVVSLLLPFCPLKASADFTFKVLTLNAWMLRLPLVHYSVSKDIGARAKILPVLIAQTGADIALLEEVWPVKIRSELVSALHELGYTYAIGKSRHFSPRPLRGIMGNGLLIVSKFPLDPTTQVLRFSKFTRPDEYFAFKGAIKTRVDVPQLGFVDLYAAHLGAVSYASSKKEYKSKQEVKKSAQARQLANWIVATKTEKYQILGADLNSHYRNFEGGQFNDAPSEVYEVLIHDLGFVDTYHAVNGFPAQPDCTYCADNAYVAQGLFGKAPGEMEDYVMTNKNDEIKAVGSSIVFKEGLADTLGANALAQPHLKTVPARISDHYGVLTTFRVRAGAGHATGAKKLRRKIS